MIRFKKMKPKEVTKDFLNDIDRHQITNRIKYMDKGILQEKELHLEENWDSQKKERYSAWLREHVLIGNTVIVGAFDGPKLVGFASINKPLFHGFINLHFLHVSEQYRGQDIGKTLLCLIALEAYELGANKLYLATHPAINTQAFYKRQGCVLASYIHPELLAHEPTDIQLELTINYEQIITKLVHIEMNKYPRLTSVIAGRIASKIYKYLPNEESLFLKVCRAFIQTHNRTTFSIGTLWLKRRKSVIHMRNMEFFEKIVLEDIKGWGEVDQFCYRVMNPMIELVDSNYAFLNRWSVSDNKDVRRVSLVSMIRSSGKLTLEYDYQKMIGLVQRLKNDDDIHVKKAVGWVLKCAYVTYKDEVTEYLKTNVKTLDRLIYRYALEHATKEEKEKLMSL